MPREKFIWKCGSRAMVSLFSFLVAAALSVFASENNWSEIGEGGSDETSAAHISAPVAPSEVSPSDSRAAYRVRLWSGSRYKAGDSGAELQVFPAPEQRNTGVGVIVCPGGSYYWLDGHTEGTKIATWLNANGISAFVLRYRRALWGNHFPDMFEDIQKAMYLVREGAASRGGKSLSERCGVNPETVGVMGFSAGGHLAGMLGTWWDWDVLSNREKGHSAVSLRPSFTVMVYPVVSMRPPFAHTQSRLSLQGNSFENEEIEHRLSLEECVREDMPPVFLTCCRDDETVRCENSEEYDKALTEKGVNHVFYEWDESGHGFGADEMGGRNRWAVAFLEWLKTIL